MSAQVVTSADTAVPNKTLQFHLIKAFEDIESDDSATTNCSLEISQRYGVSFILHNGNLRIIESKSLLLQQQLPGIVRNNVSAIGLSSDDSLLAISSGSSVSIYETKMFCQQPGSPAKTSFMVSKSGAATSQLAWNPADVRLIAALGQDGTVLLIRVLDNWSIEAVTATDSGFRCMSWSPKGKQLVVGGTNGIVQLKLDLKEAKKIPLPPGLMPISIHWLSTLQFLVSFQPNSQDDLKITLLTLSKTAPPLYKDYGDVFLSDDFTNARVLSKLIPQWRMHILGSSTSSDIIVATHDPSQPTSDLVIQEIEDRYRAALPLDHFCRGSNIYLGSSESVVINGEDLQGSPLLVLLSQKGRVILFRIVNAGFESIHIPTPEPLRVAVATAAIAPALAAEPPAAQPQQVTPAPAFGNINLGATPNKSLFGLPQPTLPSTGSLFGAPTSTPSFFGAPKSTAPVAPSSASILPPAAKNLFGTTPNVTAPPATGLSFMPVQPKVETKPVPAAGLSFGFGASAATAAQPQTGAGDASHVVQAQQPVAKLPTKQVAPEQPPQPQAYDYKHLLDQLKHFQQRYLNFKKLHQQETKAQSDAVNQYFAQLDSQILKDLHKISDFARDIVETTNGQKEEVDGLYMAMQNLFTKIEYGLIAAEKSKDSKYLRLLRAQPIDPQSMAKLTKVDRNYTYLKNQLTEARRHFYLQEQNLRPLDGSVSVDFLYQTMANHRQIIENLSLQAAELRQQLLDQNIQLVSSMGNSTITLDDIASGISRMKLKPSDEEESQGMANHSVVYSKGTVDQLRRWAGHTIITRVPATGGIDPHIPLSQVRKIRLNPDSFDDTPATSTSFAQAPAPAQVLKPEVTPAAPPTSLFGTATMPKSATPTSLFAGIAKPAASIASVASLGSFSSASSTSAPSFFSSSVSTALAATSAAAPASSTQADGSKKAAPAFDFSSMSGTTATSFFGSSQAKSSSLFGSVAPAPTTTAAAPAFSGIDTSSLSGATTPGTVTSSFKGIGISSAGSATSTAPPAFGFTNAPTSVSLFGTKATPAATAASSLVTSTPAPPASLFGSSMFGAPKTTTVTTTTSSLFAPTTTTTSSIFAAPKTTDGGSLFGIKPAEGTSLFGSSTLPTSSVFGVPKSTEASSVFGVPNAAVSSSGLGTAATSTAVSTSMGATKPEAPVALTTTPTATSESVKTTAAPAAPLFGTKLGTASGLGQPTTTTTSSSFFGSSPLFAAGSGTSLFGTNLFGTSTAATTTTSSLFGTSTAPTSSTAVTSVPSIFGTVAAAKPTATATSTQSLLFGTPKPTVATSTATPTALEAATTAETAPVTPAAAVTTTAPASTANSILGSLLSSPPGAVEASVSAAPATAPSPSTTTATPVASAVSPADNAASSLFGSMSLSATAPAPTSEQSSLFQASAPKSTSSIFGGGTVTAVTTTTAAPLFGSPATATATSTSSLFGAPPNISLFATPPSTTSAGFFGTPAAGGSIAGAGIFGGAIATAAPVTTSASLFGTPTQVAGAATTTTTSLFGTPTGTSIFGKPATTSTPSIFGGGAATSPAAGVFGSPSAATAAAGSSLFGASTATPSLFGGGGAAKPAEPGSIFGGGSTSMFGGSGASGVEPKSVFGSPTQPVQSPGTGSVFGGPAFGSSGGFGAQSPSATAGTPGGFGSPSFGSTGGGGGILKPAAATFGQGASVFGGVAPANTSASAFGSPSTAPAFGGGAVFGSSPAFGSALKPSSFTTSNIFGGGSPGAGSSFGGLAGTATQAPPTAAFGSPPAFGSPQQPQQPQPAFGGGAAFGGTPAFGTPAQTSSSVFGGPAFGSSGGASAFGQQPASNPSFGGGAVFGGSPAFGSTGKTASFGASSTSSIFGGGGGDSANVSFGAVASNPQPGFGQTSPGAFASPPPQQQQSFGSFGAGAFGQAQPQSPPPAFGGPAFGGGAFGQTAQNQPKPASFGGQSFSSWR